MTVPVQLEPYFYELLKVTLDRTGLSAQQTREEQKAAALANPALKNLPKVLEEEKTIPTSDGKGTIELTITRLPGTENEKLPVIVYYHGGGWVLSDKHTHQIIRYELTARARAVVVFVNYSLSPEVRHPVALEECYDTLAWIAKPENASSIGADAGKIAVAGDSAGGNLATAVSILAKQRGLSAIKYQVLYYPVTDANFDTKSYTAFATDHYLTRDQMKWFWNHYIPNEKDRSQITASPLRASIDDLKGLPPALVITAEADVLRDEGEAYARKLLQAGVEVVTARYLGILHGVFNMPNLTPSGEAILDQTVSVLRRVWYKSNAHL